MSVLIRPAEESDARQLVQLRRRLFAETAFMLWEPDEFTATAEDELLFIRRLASRPNSRLLSDHGWQAVMDGALWQFADLVITGYLGMAAYIVFKTCEHRLTNWLGDRHL